MSTTSEMSSVVLEAYLHRYSQHATADVLTVVAVKSVLDDMIGDIETWVHETEHDRLAAELAKAQAANSQYAIAERIHWDEKQNMLQKVHMLQLEGRRLARKLQLEADFVAQEVQDKERLEKELATSKEQIASWATLSRELARSQREVRELHRRLGIQSLLKPALATATTVDLLVSHSTSFPEDLKNDLSGLLLRAGRLISGSIRCQLHFKLLTDDGANVDEAAILHGLRMAAAASFAKKVHQLVDKLSPPTDAKYSVQARDIFERRLRVCLECRFKDGTPNQHDNHDLGPKKGLKTNPIDTRTVIPRRSGHTNVPQKASAEPIHVHPHTKEKFVYRGGFRLPKNGSKPSTDGIEAPVDLNDHPCLEKVALVGTFQVRDEYGV
ncbi:hypothetical protein DYB35_000190 [Aphanomyces astaci]|uniref:Uncharacterized protein n=1 Tax=Aphanomyces astaci TaxID=112090 RepID=A0A418CLZ5_APHAT|nr:hypothetical protein DYB35_000190 [Aphanomyces astaci]